MRGRRGDRATRRLRRRSGPRASSSGEAVVRLLVPTRSASTGSSGASECSLLECSKNGGERLPQTPQELRPRCLAETPAELDASDIAASCSPRSPRPTRRAAERAGRLCLDSSRARVCEAVTVVMRRFGQCRRTTHRIFAAVRLSQQSTYSTQVVLPRRDAPTCARPRIVTHGTVWTYWAWVRSSVPSEVWAIGSAWIAGSARSVARRTSPEAVFVFVYLVEIAPGVRLPSRLCAPT